MYIINNLDIINKSNYEDGVIQSKLGKQNFAHFCGFGTKALLIDEHPSALYSNSYTQGSLKGTGVLAPHYSLHKIKV